MGDIKLAVALPGRFPGSATCELVGIYLCLKWYRDCGRHQETVVIYTDSKTAHKYLMTDVTPLPRLVPLVELVRRTMWPGVRTEHNFRKHNQAHHLALHTMRKARCTGWNLPGTQDSALAIALHHAARPGI